MNRINKLDGLRGLFCLFVVLFHLNQNNAPLFIVQNFFVRGSYMFVDFFFILSGYVITLHYHEKIKDGKSFLYFIKKRFLRLYPLLLFSTGMYWYFVHPQFDRHHQLLALDTLLLTNSTPLLGNELGMNYPSWSISSEMISYLIFGTVSLIANGKNRSKIIAAITISCFAFLLYQQNYFATSDYGFVRGLACFNLGYFIFNKWNKATTIHNIYEYLVSILVILLIYLQYQVSFNNKYLQTLFQTIVPFVYVIAIITFMQTNGLLSKMLASRPFQFLGKISYSVYLNHAFVIGYGIPKLYQWIHLTNGENKKAIVVLLLLLIIMMYSWITQFLIEQKLGNQLKSILKV